MTRHETEQALQVLATLAVYITAQFPHAPGETVAEQAIWLLEQGRRLQAPPQEPAVHEGE